MALHDIDNSTPDRSGFTPNAPDNVAQRMAHATTSTSYTPANTNPRTQRTVNSNNNAIVNYDTNNLISAYYGVVSSVSTQPIFIIAKPGKDVFTDVLGIARPAGL